jgi:hypothetical protein
VPFVANPLSPAGDMVHRQQKQTFHAQSPSFSLASLSTAGYKYRHKSPKSPRWTTGTRVVNLMLVREAIASHYWSSRHPMKANNTTNLASVVMLVVLTPFLALAVLVSIKTAGIRNNEVLLLLLTLSSAVLSGINGFGRRTSTAIPVSTAKTVSRKRLHLSARSSNNA